MGPVSDDEGWRPLQKPDKPARGRRAGRRRGAETDADPAVAEVAHEAPVATVAPESPDAVAPGVRPAFVSPFVRVARVHGASAAADAMVTVALAGSLFFDIDPDAARWRVLLYLLLTAAPFAVVGPFIGPALDRAQGGRRTVIIIINALRVMTTLLMIPNLDSLLLFPIAFAHLVLGKSYAVAKAAIVPTTVSSDAELVDKNSRLTILSGVAGAIGAAPAVLLSWLGGPAWAVGLAMVAYAAALFLATQLPSEEPVEQVHHASDVQEVRSRGIFLAASAMAVMRSIVGFMTWMVAFAFRGGVDDIDLSAVGKSTGAAIRTALGYPVVDESVTSAWQLGVILAAFGGGAWLGSFSAPRMRDRFGEEQIVLGALGSILISAFAALWLGGLLGAGVLALVVGVGASMAKVAFDAIVQRDSPDTNHGAAFARFETRFQIAWVVGALVPVIFRTPPRLGFLLIACAALCAALLYWIGSRSEGHDGSVRSVLGSLPGADRLRAARDNLGADRAEQHAEEPRESRPAPAAVTPGVATPDAGRERTWRSEATEKVPVTPAGPSTQERVGKVPVIDENLVEDLDVPAWMDPSQPEVPGSSRSVFEQPPTSDDPPMWDDHR